MTDQVREIGGLQVLVCPAAGPALATAADALDLIGRAGSAGAALIALPVTRLAPDFFVLSTGLLGEFAQKLVNYGQRLVLVGDMEAHVQASRALRDFVREANRGRQIWFVRDEAELARRLEVP